MENRGTVQALAFAGFLAAMLVVYAVAQEVMAVLQCVGFASGISDAMLGITLLAWGNSVGGKRREWGFTPLGKRGANYDTCIPRSHGGLRARLICVRGWVCPGEAGLRIACLGGGGDLFEYT